MIVKKPTSEEEFTAFTGLYKVSPYYQFAHFTANQAILEAFEREEDQNLNSLHIDFDVSHGFQWPSLIQSLSRRPQVITGSRWDHWVWPGLLRSSTTRRAGLSASRMGSGISFFEFQGLIRGSKLINVRKKKQETVCREPCLPSQHVEQLHEDLGNLKDDPIHQALGRDPRRAGREQKPSELPFEVHGIVTLLRCHVRLTS
ncbi:hypothetical protein MLD38_001101 [Melastoma candidum]|uniref:Uncharacterized protein n=1 Tax=Melastoma candidum TaxID=119954 RepID=A0ACB9SG32_9MYRT|nr:hypothetical protein MLD38_001101 [Melastoma candidum]